MKQDLSWTKLPVLNLTPGFEPFGPSTVGEVKYIDYPSGVEPHVRIAPRVHQEGTERHYLFTARPTNPTELMRVLLAPSAMPPFETRMELFMPYMPHARQDRRAVPEDAASLQVVRELLRVAGYHRLHVFDLHNPDSLQCTPWDTHRFVQNYDPTHFIEEVVRMERSTHCKGTNPILVVPDHGMSKRLLHMVAYEAQEPDPTPFAQLMITHEQLVCAKTRDSHFGALSIAVPHNVPVKDRVCIIIDDICDGGGTFLPLVTTLKERGAKRVVLVVSHGLFTKGYSAFRKAKLDQVYTTNSWNVPTTNGKLRVTQRTDWHQLLGA